MKGTIFAILFFSRKNTFLLIIGACSYECSAYLKSFFFAFARIIVVWRNLNSYSINADGYEIEADENNKENINANYKFALK
jgi:hypothetical protein